MIGIVGAIAIITWGVWLVVRIVIWLTTGDKPLSFKPKGIHNMKTVWAGKNMTCYLFSKKNSERKPKTETKLGHSAKKKADQSNDYSDDRGV
jgi:hypothetical protein